MINQHANLKQFVMLLFALSGFGASAAFAQVTVTEIEEGDDQIEIIEMTVSPAAQPSPIFKHRLTWLPHETTAGNAATVYLSSFSENFLNRTSRQAKEAVGEEFEEWAYNDTPRESIPIDKLRKASAFFDEYVKLYIERASMRRDCDWGYQLEDLQGPLSIGLSLNGLQETRSASRVLALQTKLAILESRFDDAVKLMKMNYRLAEHVGQVKVLVASLICFAEVGITNGNMVDFIAAQDSPNMYWALTELPRPFADLRGAFRLECAFMQRIFPALGNVESQSHSPEEWASIVAELSESAWSMPGESPPTGMKFIPTAIGVLSYGPAKERLIAQGLGEEKVEAMPVGQVLMLDASREYQLLADQMEKEVYLSFPIATQRAGAVEKMLMEQEKTAFNSFGKIMATMMLPAVQAVLGAGARTQRDIDALRLIEALRMHAAEHGKFPASLDEISVVPVPDNPATGKAFEYRLDGKTAVVELPSAYAIHYSKRYRITLR